VTNLEQIQAFTQEVNLTIYNRLIVDIGEADGQEAVAKTTIWLNLFLDELAFEKNPDDTPVNWLFLRKNDTEIGEIDEATDTFDLPRDALRLVSEEDRPLYITQDGTVISTWDVVEPDQLTSRNDYINRDNRVSYVGEQIVFSRPLNDTEIGGTIFADVVNKFPQLVSTSGSENVDLFKLPIPRQLLVLGTAKNASLPDIVQGGLSPSYAQKYDNLLEGVKAANMQSAAANQVVVEDYSDITGVY